MSLLWPRLICLSGVDSLQIPGYKSPEQEEAEQRERIRRQKEQKKREQERKAKAKREEIETWWSRAKLRFATEDESEENDQENNQQSHDRQAIWKNRALAAYKARDANDYSVWTKWEPQDPATKEERELQKRELEKQRNKEFEANNPEFCTQFQEDLAKRQSSQKDKERAAESKPL